MTNADKATLKIKKQRDKLTIDQRQASPPPAPAEQRSGALVTAAAHGNAQPTHKDRIVTVRSWRRSPSSSQMLPRNWRRLETRKRCRNPTMRRAPRGPRPVHAPLGGPRYHERTREICAAPGVATRRGVWCDVAWRGAVLTSSGDDVPQAQEVLDAAGRLHDEPNPAAGGSRALSPTDAACWAVAGYLAVLTPPPRAPSILLSTLRTAHVAAVGPA